MNPITADQTPDNSTTATRSNCCFIVTGFGPFRGVPDNPTSVLIRRLREVADNKIDNGDPSSSLSSSALIKKTSSNNITIRETHILETSAEYVREKIDDIYGRLKESFVESAKINIADTVGGDVGVNSGNNEANVDDGTSNSNKAKNVIVVLHLGVNYRGKQFQIDQCAYNEATFRVPDERGYQPCDECILLEGGHDDETGTTTTAKSHELGKCFETTLDVQNLCLEMQKCNETISSRDPGRFVCNFTYCLSLDRCHSTNMCSDRKEAVYHALFIHVPPFNVVSEEKQLEFILKVMQAIELQVSGQQE